MEFIRISYYLKKSLCNQCVMFLTLDEDDDMIFESFEVHAALRTGNNSPTTSTGISSRSASVLQEHPSSSEFTECISQAICQPRFRFYDQHGTLKLEKAFLTPLLGLR